MVILTVYVREAGSEALEVSIGVAFRGRTSDLERLAASAFKESAERVAEIITAKDVLKPKPETESENENTH